MTLVDPDAKNSDYEGSVKSELDINSQQEALDPSWPGHIDPPANFRRTSIDGQSDDDHESRGMEREGILVLNSLRQGSRGNGTASGSGVMTGYSQFGISFPLNTDTEGKVYERFYDDGDEFEA